MPSFSFSGGVEVLGFISPTDTNDTYPVIDPLYGIDGLRNVNTITELNSITNQRRRAGMIVGVGDGLIYYKLNSPPWNGSLSDWSIFQSGGGGTFTGGTISGDTIFTQGVTATTLNVNGVSITGDTYTTGGTYSSGILNFNYNTGGGYQINGLDTTNTYITGFTYDNINTFNINDNSGNTFSSSINVLSATTISGGTFYGDGSNLTNTPDKYITDISFNNSNYDLTVTRSDSWSDTVSLSILSSDMTITGGTYNSGTGVATFTNNSGGTFNVSGFLVGYTDRYVTGYTYDNSNTFNIFDNSGNTFSASINEVSGLTVNGSLSATTISAATYYNLPVVNDTNFANTDLTFSGFREHDLNGYGMYLTTDGGGYNEAFFTLDTVSTSFGLLTPNGANIIYQTAAPLTPGVIENIGASAIRTHTLTESTFFINTSRNFIIRQESTPTQPTFLIDGSSNNVGVGTIVPTAKLHINNVTSGNTFLAEDSTNPDSSPFVIDTNGNTGIGTTTPTAKLQVRVNDFNVSNTGFAVTNSGNTDNYFTVSNVGQVGIRTPYSGSNFQFAITNTNYAAGQVRFNVSGDYQFTILDTQGYGFTSSPNSISINTRSTNGNVNIWTQAGNTTRLNLGGQDLNPTVARTRTIINPVNSSTTSFIPTGGTAVDYSFENTGATAFQPTGGTATYTQIQLRPTYNTTGSYSGIIRGLFYNPILTSLSGATHRAIETTTGNVIFGSTSGNVGIGTTTPSAKLDIVGGNVALNNNTLHLGTNLGNTVLRTTNSGNDVQLFNNNFTGNLLLNSANLITFGSNQGVSNRWATFFNTGNLLIQSGGTHTDVGFRLDVSGNTRVSGTLNVSGTTNLKETIINDNKVNIVNSFTPTGSTDPSYTTGTIAWDDNYLYWKTSTQWLRVSGSTW